MNPFSLFRYIFSYRFSGRLRALFWSKIYRHSSSKACICRGVYLTPKYISWDKRVIIFKKCRVEGVTKYLGVSFSPMLTLGEGVSIQQHAHITFASKMHIGSYTAIASNVTITDIDHPYEDPKIPIEYQPLKVHPVEIGSDCKIYNNAVILQGTKIGHHCVVGANSVVKGVFPDYSIIVGVPGRIVKRYDAQRGSWRKTHPNGNFKDDE